MTVDTFLKEAEWGNAIMTQFPADWSSRHYARLKKPNGDTAILLQSPPDHSPDSVIGHKIGEWVKINHHLKSLGLNEPSIYAQDMTHGFVLMEDFGHDTIVGKGLDAYMAATDVLITMRDHKNALNIDLLKYEKTHVYNALKYFPEFILKDKNLTDGWLTTWHTIEQSLPPCPRAFTHIDFGAANLMWLPERDHTDKIGILDFQAACDGPFVYDIVNLLEDARRTIPDDIKQKCMNHYCAQLSPNDRHAFDAWFLVITTQFHARVLGQIVKLKEQNGRDDLMQFYRQLWNRFELEIQIPSLTPIRKFIEDHHKHD